MELVKNLALATDVVTTSQSVTPDWMVVVMGVGVVFAGLVLIIVLCKIMGLFFSGTTTGAKEVTPVAKTTPVAASAKIENRQEIIAAVAAACAEDMGKDVSALRVVSFKKL